MISARLAGKFTMGEGCWLWNAAVDEDGYGRVRANGKNRYAHRIMYEILVGPVPDGLELDHLCRNRRCVRPEHLEPVTRQENCLRSPIMGKAGLAKTMCPKGHPYDEENTIRSRGKRECRLCRLERNREYKARRKIG